MNRSTWPLLCIALAASAAVHARDVTDDDGNQPGGRRESSQRTAPERSAPAPRAPDAVPAPPRPPSVPTPRFGVDRPGAQPGAPRGERPAQRPSDPSQGRWSTVQPGQGGNDRNWSDRNAPRRDEPRGADNRRNDDVHLDERRDDRSWQRNDWQRSRVTEPPRRVYQWRDYDRYRLQHFRFDDGRYFGRSRYHAGAFLWPRGFGVRLWLIGEWLPSTFFLDSRYMLDYWRFGLYQPPAGCRWVRVGDDALLVDDFNGEVLDVVYSLFW